MKGARLSGGRYEEQAVTRSVSGELTLSSEVLGLDVVVTRDGELRFRDPATGEYLRSPQEEHDRAEREAAARRAAEERIAELLRERGELVGSGNSGRCFPEILAGSS